MGYLRDQDIKSRRTYIKGEMMFKKLYERYYKSRKTVSKERAKALRNDISLLKEQISKREVQIEKFNELVKDDPENKERYQQRIKVHKEFIKNELYEIEEIEIILLDS